MLFLAIYELERKIENDLLYVLDWLVKVHKDSKLSVFESTE
jgi:hypothetical protein